MAGAAVPIHRRVAEHALCKRGNPCVESKLVFGQVSGECHARHGWRTARSDDANGVRQEHYAGKRGKDWVITGAKVSAPVAYPYRPIAIQIYFSEHVDAGRRRAGTRCGCEREWCLTSGEYATNAGVA